MQYGYPAIFTEERDGVTVTFPDVPEAVTWGATRPEARERAADALIGALSVYVEDDRPNPTPSPAHGCDIVSVTALEATKLALHDAMLAAGMSNRELAGRLGLEEKAVRRLRDPLQRSAIGAVEAALRCLGKRVEVTVSDAARRERSCRASGCHELIPSDEMVDPTADLHRHGRPCAGHPRLFLLISANTWMGAKPHHDDEWRRQ